MTLPIIINNQNFTLHCSGALFWEEQNILLISDVHLGKVTHFRKHGIALPPDSVKGNFAKLSKVVDFFKPKSVYFLGDLFHSKINSEWELFENWSLYTDAEMVLVAGNHDIISPMEYHNIGIRVHQEIIIDGFLLTHHPEQRDECFNFCGHIHPGILLHGFGRQFLELPCFFQSAVQMILPAFGEFTGKYVLKPAKGNIVYALTKDDVMLVYD